MKKETHHLTMDDGVKLATDVYLPEDGRQFPVLLMLTPYGRINKRIFAELVVPEGYALVVQDVRGTYGSGGNFDPIHQEKTDGPATVDWIVSQPWYDETCGIGILGFSYLATVGFSVAARRESVRAMINVGGLSNLYDLTHRGGALVLHHALPWTIITSYSPQPSLEEIPWDDVYRTLPLEEAANRAGFDNELWRTWATQPLREAAWERLSVKDELQAVDIPILHCSGWYDLTLGCTLELYEFFRENATNPQHLIIGPWTHNGVLMGPTELHGYSFGAASRPNMAANIIHWFDSWLKDDAEALGTLDLNGPENPVLLFVTGSNSWVRAMEWPAADSSTCELELGRELVLSAPDADNPHSTTYCYDPENPCPTIGGATWEFPAAGLEPGPADQSQLHSRDDVILFSTPTLDEQFTVLGPVNLKLYAATDSCTTDFTAKLLDLAPDGTARVIAAGIRRGDIVEEGQKRRPIEPGRVMCYDIDMWGAAHTFLPGHRVGLEVSSSNFPQWERSLNTTSGTPRVAHQKLFWGDNYPTHLKLHKLNKTL